MHAITEPCLPNVTEVLTDLHLAIQAPIKSIAARHEPKTTEESNPEKRRGKGRKL